MTKCDRCGKVTKDLSPHDSDRVHLCDDCSEKWIKIFDSEVKKTSMEDMEKRWNKLFYAFVKNKIQKEKVRVVLI